MEELYSIMRDFLEVEYHQESLLFALDALEAAYSEESQRDARLIVSGAKYYLKALQQDLKAAISGLDTYTAKQAKKQ